MFVMGHGIPRISQNCIPDGEILELEKFSADVMEYKGTLQMALED